MTHTLVMMLSNEDGEMVEKEDRAWCFVEESAGCRVTLCTGEVFDYGDGTAEAKTKEVKRGGITCNKCLRMLRHYKSIKL